MDVLLWLGGGATALAAIGFLLRAPIKWLWQKNVVDPYASYLRDQFVTVIGSPNGAGNLHQITERLDKRMVLQEAKAEALTEFATEARGKYDHLLTAVRRVERKVDKLAVDE